MRAKISEQHREKIIRLRKKGFTTPMIAEKIGCCISTAWQVLKQEELTEVNKGQIPKVLQEIMLNQEASK